LIFAYSMLLPNASFIIPEEPEEWDWLALDQL
jgi:hypothetical protein